MAKRGRWLNGCVCDPNFKLSTPHRMRPPENLLLQSLFTLRLHVMQRTALLSQFCSSVCICVYCDKTKSSSVNISTPYIRNRDISSLSTSMEVTENCPLLPEIFAKIDPPLCETRRFQHIPDHLHERSALQSFFLWELPAARLYSTAIPGCVHCCCVSGCTNLHGCSRYGWKASRFCLTD